MQIHFHAIFFTELVTKYLTASEEDKLQTEEKLKDEVAALKNMVQEIKKYK